MVYISSSLRASLATYEGSQLIGRFNIFATRMLVVFVQLRRPKSLRC